MPVPALLTGALTEVHLGRLVRLPVAGRPDPIQGTLTGLWPFAAGMHALRLESAEENGIHLVRDDVWLEVW